MLRRHAADDVGTLKLIDLKLVKHDDDDYVAVHRSVADLCVGVGAGVGGGVGVKGRDDNENDGHLLIVDWSRQRMTNDTMGHLMSLSTSMEVKEKILDLAWGKLAPDSKLRSKLPRGDRGTFDQHLLPYNRVHDNGGRPKTTLDGFGRRRPWTPDCIDVDDECDADIDFGVRFDDRVSLHNKSHEQRKIDDENASKLNSATRKYFEDQRRYDKVDSDIRREDMIRRNKEEEENNVVTSDTEEGGSMHLAYRAPADKGLFMRDPHTNDKKRNVLDDVHSDWKRIRRIADLTRRGKSRGASGQPLCDVVVVCAGGEGGVVPHALEFVYRALEHDGVAHTASLVDPNSGSINELTGPGGGKGEPTMEMKLKEVADGVVNMVTTPFKSKSASGGITTPFKSNYGGGSSSTAIRRRKLKILTSIDPSAMREVLSELSPATTVVVTIDVDTEGEHECQEITLAVKEWLLSMADGGNIGGNTNSRTQTEDIVRKHMYLVSGNEMSVVRGSKNPSNAFVLPRHSRCEAFSTFSSAGILPLSLIYGWDVMSTILLGAHDMDLHFVDTCPRQNIPILLALIDLWNEAFLQSNGRILTPFVRAYGSYPLFVAALEHKVLKASAKMPETKSFGSRGRNEEPQPVIDGGSNAYNNTGRGGSNLASTEFLTTLDPPILPGSGIGTEVELVANHDKRMCSLFARADTLAFGVSNAGDKGRIFHSPGSPPTIIRNDTMTSQTSANNNCGNGNAKTESGNQPSTILFCGKCDAFTCGQLVALAEHRALVKAWLWDINPFAVTKSSIQQERQEFLSEKLYIMNNLLSEGVDLDEADGNDAPDPATGGGIRIMNSATNTVLKHYATRLKHRRRDMPRTPSRMFT